MDFLVLFCYGVWVLPTIIVNSDLGPYLTAF